jgi:hypothetical protein
VDTDRVKLPKKFEDKMTRYGLNLTGSNILFLIEKVTLNNKNQLYYQRACN